MANARRLSGAPTILTTVDTQSFSGHMWPELLDVFPEQEPIERTGMNSWDTEAFRAAIRATGKKNIILSGLWTEVCITWPALHMLAEGYNIYVVEDACGSRRDVDRTAGLARLRAAGCVPVTVEAILFEWLGTADNPAFRDILSIIKEAR